MHPAACADQQGWGRWRAAPLRVGSPAGRNARARCSGPPCTTPQQLLQLRSVYRARPSATRRSLTTATARLQSLRGSSPSPAPGSFLLWRGRTPAAGEWAPLERSCAVGIMVAGRELARGQQTSRRQGARGLRLDQEPTEPRSEGEPRATAAAKSRSLKVTNTPSGHA